MPRFAETAAQVRDAFTAKGFGVLTEIDVRATLRDKLGQEMEDSLILGVRNPPPPTRHSPSAPRSACCCRATWCCATARARPIVEALDPQTMVTVTGQPALQPVADKVASRLRATLDCLRESRGIR